MFHLKKFIISPLNDQFIFKDDQYLLGKTDEKSDNFDILIYALRDISEARIPSNIKIISSYAFCDCLHLKEVIFEENSELEIVEESAFSISIIEKIFIPPNVTKISKYAFADC